MTKKITIILALIFLVFIANSQINGAFLNNSQKSILSNCLVNNKIEGFVEFSYSNEKDLSKNKPNNYSVILIDSLGNKTKAIGFDKDKKCKNYTLYEYDDMNRLKKEMNFNSDNTLLGFYEYYYDMFGELIESIQYGKEGSINSKTLRFHNNKGLLYKAEVVGPDGNLTFNRSVKHNTNGFPISVELKHAKGFLMSNDIITYNKENLPVEKILKVGMTGKTTRFTCIYNQSNLLEEERFYRDEELDYINTIKYYIDDFEQYLSVNDFNINDLNGNDVTIEKQDYFFKSLAKYPGGEEELKIYLRKNTVYPSNARKKGVVIVGFAINTDGGIIDIEVHRGLSKKLDKKAISIIKGMPNWIPAQKTDGSLYKSTVSVSIAFLN